MPVQAPRSTTRQLAPERILESPNSLTAGLFIKEPLPSQRIQLKPSNFPTFIDESLATNSESIFAADSGKLTPRK